MPRHLVILVHGIRTFGQWQERLAALIKDAEPSVDARPYKYGYFSALAFIFPPARLIETLRFRSMLRLVAREKWDRIDIVAHSFGTHIVAHALRGLCPQESLKIHTVILAGSVLRSTFPWDGLLAGRIGRVVNECGTRDSILLLSQFLAFIPPFTGMAGRSGFFGLTSEKLVNRFHRFRHSDYFLKENKPDDGFMRANWVPLVTEDKPVPAVDERGQLTAWRALLTFATNNATPIKLAIVAILLLVPWLYYRRLYRDATMRLVDSLIAQGRTQEAIGDTANARDFYTEARKDLQTLGEETVAADLALYHAYSVLPTALQVSDRSEAFIDDLAVAPDGRTAATVENDQILLWDLLRGLPTRQLSNCGAQFTPSHLRRDQMPVPAIVFARGGAIVVAAEKGGGVAACEASTGNRLWSAPGFGSSVVVLAITRDGDRVAAGTKDGSIKIVDARSGATRATLRRHRSAISTLCFSPDGQRMLSAATDGRVNLWDLHANGSRLLEGRSKRTAAVGFSADGQLAIGAGASDIAVWDVASGRLAGSSPIDVSVNMRTDPPILAADGSYLLGPIRPGPIRMIAVSEQERLGEMTLFSVYLDRKNSSGSVIPRLRKVWMLPNYATDVVRAAFPRGADALVIATHRRLELWDARPSGEPQTFGKQTLLGDFGGSFQKPGLSDDGLLGLARDGDEQAGIFDLATLTNLQTFVSPGDRVESVALAMQGKVAAIGKSSGRVDLWDTVSAVRLTTIDAHAKGPVSLTLAPDGTQLLVRGQDGVANAWALPDGAWLYRLSDGSPRLTDAAYSPDSKSIAVTTADGNIAICSAANGQRIRRFKGSDAGVYSVAYSRDQSRLITTCDDKALRVWDARSGKQHARVDTASPRNDAAFLSSRRWAVSAGTDRSVKFWDLAAGKVLFGFPVLHEGPAAIAVARNGMLVWTASAYSQNLLWDLDAGLAQQEYISKLGRARAVLRQNPTDADALNQLGHWYAFRRRCEWAATLFEVAKNKEPPVETVLDRFQCFATTGRLDLARAELQRVSDSHLASPVYVALWRQALQRGSPR